MQSSRDRERSRQSDGARIRMKITRRQLRQIIRESLITESVSSPPPGEVKGAELMRASGQYMVGNEVYIYSRDIWNEMTPEEKDRQWVGLVKVQS
jgi:hypothetical protein